MKKISNVSRETLTGQVGTKNRDIQRKRGAVVREIGIWCKIEKFPFYIKFTSKNGTAEKKCIPFHKFITISNGILEMLML